MTSISSSSNNSAEEHLSALSSTLPLDTSSGQAPAPTQATGSCCDISNCQGSALWKEIACGKRRVCRQHKEIGVVHSQLVPICAQEDCFEEPCFDTTITPSPARTGKRKYCVKHTTANSNKADGTVMAKSRSTSCAAPGCDRIPSFGVGGRREMCRDHRGEGMTCNTLTCESPLCNKNPSFAARGDTRRRFCKRHAEPHMVNMYYKYCDTGECLERAAFEAGSQLRCLAHKEPGMTPRSNICQVAGGGCARQSSYGFDGGKPVVCTVHREPGMVQVRTKTCKREGCEKIPSYGFPCMSREYCKPHALEGMVYSAGKRCRFRGCRGVGMFNHPGVGGGAFCKDHKEDGMVDMQPVKCEEVGCKYGASFGDTQEKKKRFCARHKLRGMVTVQNLLAETMSVPRETPSAAVTSGSVECAEKISKRIGSTSPGTSSLLLPDGVNPVDKPSPSVQPAAVRLQNPARTRAAPKTRGTRASKRARKQATTTGMIATTITGNMVSRPPAVPPAVALASAVTPAAAALTSPGQQTQQRGAGTATGGSNADPGSGESKTVDQQRQSSAISHSTDNIAGSVPLRDDEDLDPGRGVAAQQRMSLAACLNGDTGAPAAATARIATAASFTTFAAAGIVVPDVDDPIPALVTAVNPHEHNQQSGMPFQSSRPISIVTAATATSNACRGAGVSEIPVSTSPDLRAAGIFSISRGRGGGSSEDGVGSGGDGGGGGGGDGLPNLFAPLQSTTLDPGDVSGESDGKIDPGSQVMEDNDDVMPFQLPQVGGCGTRLPAAAAAVSGGAKVVHHKAAGFGGVYAPSGAVGGVREAVREVGLGAAAAARYVSAVTNFIAAKGPLGLSGPSCSQLTRDTALALAGTAPWDGDSGSSAVSSACDGGDGCGTGSGEAECWDEGGGGKKNLSRHGEESFLSSLLGTIDSADPKMKRVRLAMMARLKNITAGCSSQDE